MIGKNCLWGAMLKYIVHQYYKKNSQTDNGRLLGLSLIILG